MPWDKIIWLWKFYRRYLYVLAILLIFTPIQAIFQVVIPKLFGYAVDYANSGTMVNDWLAKTVNEWSQLHSWSPLTGLGLAFIGLGIIAGVLYCFVQTHRAWMNTRLEWAFRQQVFDKVTEKGPDFFNKYRTGDLVTRMTDDVAEKLSWFACSGIFRLYEALLYVLFVTIMMLQISPKLTLWTAGPLPFLIILFFKTSTKLDKRYDNVQSRISNFNDVMEACFSNIRVVKSYVREKLQFSKFDKAASDRRNNEIKVIKLQAILELLYHYLWQFAIVIVVVVGGYMVIMSELTMGQMSTFIYYSVYLIFPMFDIGQFLVKSRQSAVSIDRLMVLEKHPIMVEHSGQKQFKEDNRATLSFDDVGFAFPSSKRRIIDRLSIDIETGKTIALVGRVGAGKTWVSNLLPRLVDPNIGCIKLNGVDLRDWEISGLRKNIGYVTQEPILFSDTIKNNILMGRSEIEDSVIDWAIDIAQLKDEIASFPKALETAVGPRGITLSGGQKQRLALARALVGKPKILILDDCTSALDSRTEAALWDRLYEVLPGLTTILVTHRPDTLKRADKIYVLSEGKLVESGKHSELISNGKEYSRIYSRYELQAAVRH